MGEDKDQLPQETANPAGVAGLQDEKAHAFLDSPPLRTSSRTREYMAIVLLVGILAVAYGLWMGRAENKPSYSQAASTAGVRASGGDLESMPEVRNATTGGWVETSGVWSRFGVIGGAFDGERIVLSSGDSPRGSLGCWISPGERPMTGSCNETGRGSSSKSPSGRTCSWQIVVQEISPDSIRGAQALKAGESDPKCGADYGSRPSHFKFERPSARQNAGGRRNGKPS